MLAVACLVLLAAGVAVERGTTLVGIAVVTGVLSVACLVDGTLRRLQARRSPRAGR